MGKPAARILDNTAHGSPLLPGPGAVTVLIGYLPAWRGIPLAMAGGLQAAQTAADATVKAAETATKAAAGTPGAPAAYAAYAAEQAAKVAALASMSAMMSGFAGTSDIHICPLPTPVPPHGPGVFIDGSATVMINNMPACTVGCTVLEALGGPDKIVKGEMTVLIGDSGGGGGGGGGSGHSLQATPKPAGTAPPLLARRRKTQGRRNTTTASPSKETRLFATKPVPLWTKSPRPPPARNFWIRSPNPVSRPPSLPLPTATPQVPPTGKLPKWARTENLGRGRMPR